MTTEPITPEDAPELEALRRQVQDLQSRIDRWARNGLDILDHTRLFPSSGGLYGTDKFPARVDHSH